MTKLPSLKLKIAPQCKDKSPETQKRLDSSFKTFSGFLSSKAKIALEALPLKKKAKLALEACLSTTVTPTQMALESLRFKYDLETRTC